MLRNLEPIGSDSRAGQLEWLVPGTKWTLGGWAAARDSSCSHWCCNHSGLVNPIFLCMLGSFMPLAVFQAMLSARNAIPSSPSHFPSGKVWLLQNQLKCYILWSLSWEPSLPHQEGIFEDLTSLYFSSTVYFHFSFICSTHGMNIVLRWFLCQIGGFLGAQTIYFLYP